MTGTGLNPSQGTRWLVPDAVLAFPACCPSQGAPFRSWFTAPTRGRIFFDTCKDLHPPFTSGLELSNHGNPARLRRRLTPMRKGQTMRIVDAVKAAVAEGDDSLWATWVYGGLAHEWHLMTTRPDGRDPMIFRNAGNPRVGSTSYHGRITHVERDDGTLRPWLILGPDDYVAPASTFRRHIERRATR